MLGSRSQLNKSLRACDIQQTLSKLVPIRLNNVIAHAEKLKKENKVINKARCPSYFTRDGLDKLFA